mmetsp:Transcript_1614/g.3361  ORF Transcript_1614/g.3361 Transcript_1614/m.3361 type:complete len:200 (-) Transcript_1614:251-850(-)
MDYRHHLALCHLSSLLSMWRSCNAFVACLLVCTLEATPNFDNVIGKLSLATSLQISLLLFPHPRPHLHHPFQHPLVCNRRSKMIFCVEVVVVPIYHQIPFRHREKRSDSVFGDARNAPLKPFAETLSFYFQKITRMTTSLPTISTARGSETPEQTKQKLLLSCACHPRTKPDPPSNTQKMGKSYKLFVSLSNRIQKHRS